MKKTDLGFYLIADEEYYNLEKPDPEITYVLVNRHEDEFIVLKDGKFMGKINRQLNDMKMAARALDIGEQEKEQLFNFQKSSTRTIVEGNKPVASFDGMNVGRKNHIKKMK